MSVIWYNGYEYILDDYEQYPLILFYGEDKDSFVHQNAGIKWLLMETVFMDYKLLAHNHECLNILEDHKFMPMVLTTDNPAVDPDWKIKFNPFVDFEMIPNSGYAYQMSRIDPIRDLIWDCISTMDIFANVDKDRFHTFLNEIVRWELFSAPEGEQTFKQMLEMISDSESLYKSMESIYSQDWVKIEMRTNFDLFKSEFGAYCKLLYDGMTGSFATERFLEATDTQENVIENQFPDWDYKDCKKVLFVDYGDDKNSDKNMLAAFFVSRYVTYLLKWNENAKGGTPPFVNLLFFVPDNIHGDLSVVSELYQTGFMPVIVTYDKEHINDYTFNTILFGDDVSEEEREEILNSIRDAKGEDVDVTVL